MQEDGHVKLEELRPDQTNSESEECGDDDTDDRKGALNPQSRMKMDERTKIKKIHNKNNNTKQADQNMQIVQTRQ